MPFERAFDEDKKIAWSTAYGVMEVQDFLDELREWRQLEERPLGTPGIVDLRQLERVIASPGLSGLIDVGKETVNSSGNARIGVVTTDPSIIDMAKLISTRSKTPDSPLTFEVFASIEEAEKWVLQNPDDNLKV